MDTQEANKRNKSEDKKSLSSESLGYLNIFNHLTNFDQMGDPRTPKDLEVLQIALEEVNGPFKITPGVLVSDFIPKNGPEEGETSQPPPPSSSPESTQLPPSVGPVEQMDLMSRCLKCCRTVPCMGVILGFTAALFFGIASLTVKFIQVNPLVTVIFQCLISMTVFLPIILIKCFNIVGVPGERLALFFRGFFGAVALTTSYIAFRLIPLSDATTICASAPVFVSIVACVILKEECGVFQAFTVVVTLCGVLLISRPTFIFGQSEVTSADELRMEGTIISAVSCITAAMTYICIRKLQKTPSVVVINMYFLSNIICSIVMICAIHLIFGNEAGDVSKGMNLPKSWPEVGWIFLNGLSCILGQISITIACKIEEAGLVALARTSDIIIAFVFQLLFLSSEKVKWTSFLGAAIVFIGVSVSGLRRWLKSKPGKWDKLWLILNCGQKRPTDS